MSEVNEFERIRAEAGLSQAEIAKLIGVSQATYCRWEQGKSTPTGLPAAAWERFRASR